MTTVLDRSSSDAQTMTPRRLLLTGGLPGPLFVVASVAQGASRDSVSFTDHPPSALRNGDSSVINGTRSQEGVVQ